MRVDIPERKGLRRAREAYDLSQTTLTLAIEREIEVVEETIASAAEMHHTCCWWDTSQLNPKVYQAIAADLINRGYGLSETGRNPVKISFDLPN